MVVFPSFSLDHDDKWVGASAVATLRVLDQHPLQT